LARIGKAEPLMGLAGHPSRSVRIAAVIALRRMRHPGLSRLLSDKDEYIVTEAARAINDDHFVTEALPALAGLLKETRFGEEALGLPALAGLLKVNRFGEEGLTRRAVNACLWTGTQTSLQHLLNYFMREDAPVAMRAEAIDAASTWPRPAVLDRVSGRYRGEA